MESGPRRALAYIAGVALSSASASAVFDYETSSYFNFSGTATTEKVDVFDYDRGCFVSGTPKSLYDYGTSNFIELKFGPNGKINGFDYATSSFFDGRVKGKSISIFDYEHSNYYEYSL